MALETTLELTQWVERELGHDVSTAASSQRDDVVAQLDTAHKTILAGGGLLNFDPDGQRVRSDVTFAFARSANPKIINFEAPIKSNTTLTATATNGSTSLTLGVAPGTSNLTGWFIRVNDQDEVYRISAHTATSTAVTLDGAFVGENVAAGTFEAFKLQYTVGSSDILQIISPLRIYASDAPDAVIHVVDKDEMMSQYPLAGVDEDFPAMAAVIYESCGTLTLQFSSYPTATERAELDYIPYPSTLDTSSVNPVIPKHFRLVLAHLATYFLLLRNDDDRAGAHLQTARDKFSELAQWNEKLYSSGDPDYARVVLNCGFNGVRGPRFTDVT